MIGPRTVVFNGDLGSGKTTVSVMLAERLGLRRVSIGDLYRRMAAEHGMTAVEFNLHSQLDDKIDHYIDQLQHDIAASGERLVVDSRLAWHFFGHALKVHLVTDPVEAARRVLGRPQDAVENYASVDEARRQLTVRSESERQRFQSRYGVDKTRLRNYDLIFDTTRAAPAEVVERIVEMLDRTGEPGPVCYLDPRRVVRTSATEEEGEIVVRYRAPDFLLVSGAGRLNADETLSRMTLA
jgi:cytidylate kinase